MTEPRRVTNEDVTKFANRKCKLCLGTGWQRKWVYLDEDHMERSTGFCGCATRRFNALTADKTVKQPDGTYYWKESGV
jgi:hypothetical protein